MSQFKLLKEEILKNAKAKGACSDQYKRAYGAEDEKQLLQVIYDNLFWCHQYGIITNELFSRFDQQEYMDSGIANTGKENTGFANSGYSNSGDRNSGYSNSGNRNSGYRNSGDRNSGYSNSGYSNSGDRNSGYRNSGDSNSGNWNSGYRNSGDSNSGNWNSGNRNSGDSNSGNRNSGYRNSGDSNSGDSNSGNWNSGYRNSGDSNSGYRNSGAFCTDPDPVLYLFNKPTKMTVKEWESHEAVRLMNSLDPTIWVPDHAMTDKEKEEHPRWETTEGYLKTITMKEAWANMWHNLTDKNKKVFTKLPNFDATIFEQITGIKI
jgi:hypothetical protein